MKTLRHLFCIKYDMRSDSFAFIGINDEEPNKPLFTHEQNDAAHITRELQSIRQLEILIWRRVYLNAHADQGHKQILHKTRSTKLALHDLSKQHYTISRHWVGGDEWKEHQGRNKQLKDFIQSQGILQQNEAISPVRLGKRQATTEPREIQGKHEESKE
jgi:hypothetical protein